MLLFFWVSWLSAILVALVPILYFLAFGWGAREAEFLNKVRVVPDRKPDGPRPGREMQTYFDKFWSKGQANYLASHSEIAGLLTLPPRVPGMFWERRQAVAPLSADDQTALRMFAYREMFKARYRELIGRGRYAWPLLLLMVIVSTLSGLVVVTELRIGYEDFIAYFAGEARLDEAAVNVLFLAAQSLVWCFLGKTAGPLGPLGYGDARAIWFLMQSDDHVAQNNRTAVFKALADQLDAARTRAASQTGQSAKPQPPDIWCQDPVLLEIAFRKIALDPYTIFLVHFTSDMDHVGGVSVQNGPATAA